MTFICSAEIQFPILLLIGAEYRETKTGENKELDNCDLMHINLRESFFKEKSEIYF